MSVIKKQKIWRNVTETPNSGFFLWEVREIPHGDRLQIAALNRKQRNIYLQTLDDGFIYICCNHFFSKQQLDAYLDIDDYAEFEDVEMIGV